MGPTQQRRGRTQTKTATKMMMFLSLLINSSTFPRESYLIRSSHLLLRHLKALTRVCSIRLTSHWRKERNWGSTKTIAICQAQLKTQATYSAKLQDKKRHRQGHCKIQLVLIEVDTRSDYVNRITLAFLIWLHQWPHPNVSSRNYLNSLLVPAWTPIQNWEMKRIETEGWLKDRC